MYSDHFNNTFLDFINAFVFIPIDKKNSPIKLNLFFLIFNQQKGGTGVTNNKLPPSFSKYSFQKYSILIMIGEMKKIEGKCNHVG